MNKNFLDYTGLTKYTEKIEEFVNEKVAGLVPNTRVINRKPLSSDISLTADDVAAVPITREINGHQLNFDFNLTAAELNAVPTSRTINGKALTSDISLTPADIGVTTPDLSGYVPTSRTVNGKALTSNITLSASDIGVTPGVGKTMPEGQTVNPTAGTIATVGRGAEIFNDYNDRIYTGETVYRGNMASGEYSHSEGSKTSAIGPYSHAEGLLTNAHGEATHAEGDETAAFMKGSHAEGAMTRAESYASHAEGQFTLASGSSSHAEGTASVSSGDNSHASGYYAKASNFASCAIGKFNKPMSSNGSFNDTVGDAFVIGNGTGINTSDFSNALRLAYEGTLYLTKAYNSTGADYAEYFEWLDGNPDNEDRVGRFVSLEGNKLRLAQEGDYILGVVSGQPCIIGNADEDWLGRWEHDDFNRFVKEYLVEREVEVTPPEGLTEDELHKWLHDNDLTERDGHYFKMEVEVVDYPTASWRHKANPAYDPSQPYIERKDRQEWDAIGMVGVLSVLDDGTCLPNSYCKVSANGIVTNASSYIPRQTFRVIQRVSNNIIKVLLL